jgi:hypothetical protein
MAVETREIGAEASAGTTRGRRDTFERAVGGVLLVAGAGAVAWAIPTAVRYPMALAVAVAVTAIGAGVVWRKPWAMSGLFCLGLLLCSASIGNLLIEGISLITFSWFFVPGVYFCWVGMRGMRDAARVAASHP